MSYISKDTPLYFFTSVTNNRLPIFRTDTLKQVLAEAFNEARRSGGFHLYGYCIMPDHAHLMTGGELSPSNILRYLNGISARRVIDHLKVGGQKGSLNKLAVLARGEHKYSVWQHHANTYIVTSEGMFMQKLHYLHQNPVEAGLAEMAWGYKFSSARYWLRRSLLEDEPLEVDLKELEWRSRASPQ